MNTISGNLVKGYKLKERIGAGGFGAVYRAEQSTVGREVAVKVILPGYANRPDFIRRFESEAQLVARLEHMHIVPLYDYWRDPEGAYLVMRLLRGGSLQGALGSGPYDLESAAILLEQVAAGLTMAHRNQIVHRDIKPSNILLDEDGNAYLTDFGIAKVLNLGVSQVTDTGGIIGSPDYLAPEQARAERITPRTDIYSMGVVLYEVLTGEHPFKEASTIERLYHHINYPLPQIAGLEPDVTEGINKVIQKATAKNPEERYRDVIQLANAFREAAGLTVSRAARSIVELLTPREQEVLKLIIEGGSNREIAEDLVIEPSTVKWYVKQIYKKLNVRSRVQAIVKARELNLIVDDFVTGTTGALEELPEPDNPYKGLRAFQAVDERDFHGRDRVIQKLLSRMDHKDPNDRFLAVVGPSGSGKSSLVKAGLIPALWRGEVPGSDRWFIVEMIPGSNPLEELETALIRIAAEHGANIGEYLRRNENGLFRIPGLILPDDGSELVVVIDQFEEVFTLVEDEDARLHFLDLLVKAVTDKRSRVRVIVTLRADFYDRPLRYAEFGELMHNRVETVLPLSADEMEQAIVQPARRVGVLFEDGLVPMIIDEMLYQPGMLPLLQYALTELFEVREERLLTLEGYKGIGGAVGALGKRAEEIYLELDVEGQEYVRQMFLRLVTLGEGQSDASVSPDTRRRTPHAELLAVAQDPDMADEIIDTFTAYRLLSQDHDPETRVPTVEVAHEAILREWERLGEWLDGSRSDIRQQRQLARAAGDWERSGREASFLLRGARLEAFEAWQEGIDLSLTAVETAFLDASITAWDREKAEEAERSERERALEQRSLRRLRIIVAVLVAASIIGITLTAAVFRQSQVAQRNETAALNNAATATVAQGEALNQAAIAATNAAVAQEQGAIAAANEAEALAQKAIVEEQALAAQRQADLNQSRFLAAQSQLALQGENRDLALALGMAAVQIDDPPSEAQVALSEAAYAPGTVRNFIGHEADIYAVWLSPDGSKLLSYAVDKSIREWEVGSGQQVRQVDLSHLDLPEHFLAQTAAAFSPDGGRLLLGLADLDIALVDVETGEVIQRMVGHTSPVMEVAFSPDGRTAISGSGPVDNNNDAPPGSDLSMRLWDLESGEEIRRFEGHTHTIFALAFTPDGKNAVTGSWDGSLGLWDLETGEMLRRMVNEKDGGAYAVAISPDGRFSLATENSLGYLTVHLWDLETGQLIRTKEHNSGISSVAISPNGQLGASGDTGGEILVWELETGDVLLRMTGDSWIAQLMFSTESDQLITSYGDTLRIWSLKPGAEFRRFVHEGRVRGATYSPDGRTAISLEIFEALTLWDLETGQALRRIERPPEPADEVAFTPDGASALVPLSGYIVQYDLATGEEIQRLGGESEEVGHRSSDASDALAISPDGRTALTGSQGDGGRNLFLWDLATGEILLAFETSHVTAAAISPDGQTALTGNTLENDEDVMTLWDLKTGKAVREFEGHESLIWDVAYSPDGQTALSASWDSTLILWDLATGEIIHRLLGHTDFVRAVAFHPEGRTAVSGSRDGALILWDLATGEAIRQYRVHTAQVNKVAFSPDGRKLLSGAGDGLMIEWRIDDTLEELLAWTAANRYVPELTCSERAQFNIEPLCEKGG